MSAESQKSILITGSAGNIGKLLIYGFKNMYQVIELNKSDADISDQDSVNNYVKSVGDVDVIVHLAANPSHEASWKDILKNILLGLR